LCYLAGSDEGYIYIIKKIKQ